MPLKATSLVTQWDLPPDLPSRYYIYFCTVPPTSFAFVSSYVCKALLSNRIAYLTGKYVINKTLVMVSY